MQPSWESDELQSGIFTHFLTQVFDNPKIADKNNDSKTTLREIHDYLRQNVSNQTRREKGADQKPVIKTADEKWLSMALFE